jgi:hypothetical protein
MPRPPQTLSRSTPSWRAAVRTGCRRESAALARGREDDEGIGAHVSARVSGLVDFSYEKSHCAKIRTNFRIRTAPIGRGVQNTNQLAIAFDKVPTATPHFALEGRRAPPPPPPSAANGAPRRRNGRCAPRRPDRPNPAEGSGMAGRSIVMPGIYAHLGKPAVNCHHPARRRRRPPARPPCGAASGSLLKPDPRAAAIVVVHQEVGGADRLHLLAGAGLRGSHAEKLHEGLVIHVLRQAGSRPPPRPAPSSRRWPSAPPAARRGS